VESGSQKIGAGFGDFSVQGLDADAQAAGFLLADMIVLSGGKGGPVGGRRRDRLGHF
jgi:hypothetical protein